MGTSAGTTGETLHNGQTVEQRIEAIEKIASDLQTSVTGIQGSITSIQTAQAAQAAQGTGTGETGVPVAQPDTITPRVDAVIDVLKKIITALGDVYDGAQTDAASLK